ncbi:translocation/assembly module TamB domain-containing protein [Fulvivirga sp. 29W222]|uniref:Translocation/assembly module TamB domain-containing protein n=1 Tax=Fulvivirga marina TaxID=2494733 RepID=A0A937FVI1_9BACT|nr:translocation/assembly module TamB domain-containing protein [Fulvivirga marina]MBL6445110.1 translocation/assembly module TamB domain-containing protein [Fulvivirga marina]
MKAGKFKSILLRVLKIMGWFLSGTVLLLVLLILSLRLPVVQQFVTTKAVNFFKNKTGAEASIGSLYIDFPTDIVIEDIYVEDQQGDTLVYCHSISMDTYLWGLLDNRFEVDELEVKRLVSNIYNQNTDSTFNFQFIVNAFASSAKPKDTTAMTASPFTFAVYTADIENVKVNYDDLYHGMKLSVDLGHFFADISEFDLNQSLITVDQVTLENSEGKLTLLKETTSSDKVSSQGINIGGKALWVDNVKFIFEDKPGNMKLLTEIGHVEAQIKNLDIARHVYETKNIVVANTFVSIDQFSSPRDTANVMQDTIPASDLKLLASTEQASIENVDFRLYDHNFVQGKGFDPFHMWFQKVSAELNEVKFENGYAQGEIRSLAAKEKGGMNLEQLSAMVKYGKEESFVHNLSLITQYSNVNGDLKVIYPSIEFLRKKTQQVKIKADFSRSKFDMEDLYYFQPALKSQMPYLSGNASDVIFEGKVSGSLDDLSVSGLYVEAFLNTKVSATGKVKGLPDIGKAQWDINLKELTTTQEDLYSTLTDSLVPPNISFPASLQVSGAFRGTINDFKAKTKVSSSYGSLEADVHIAMLPDSLYTYQGKLLIDNFDLGKLMVGDIMLGKLTMQAEVDGKGFTLEEINTQIKGKVSSLGYNNYIYNDLLINGKLHAKEFNGELSMHDPNLDFDFSGLVNLNDSIPGYKFSLDLRAINLRALNFSSNDLRLKGRVVSDIRASSVENINGTLEVKDFAIARDEEVYKIDTFLLSSTTNNDKTDISIYSRVLDANFEGNFDLVTLPEVLRQHFNRYYDLNDVEDVEKLAYQEFTFSINIKRPQFFSEMIVPGLEEFQPGLIKGTYNSEQWMLDIDILVPKLVYDGIAVDSLSIGIHSDEEYLEYETDVGKLASGSFAVDHINLSGIVESDHMETDLRIMDDEKEEKYHLGGIFISGPDYYRFQFTPGKFVLNYEPWDVKPSNSLDFYPSGLWVKNFFLANDGQQIKVQSIVNPKGDSVLTADIVNFELGYLGKLEESKGYLLGGVLNGDIDFNMKSSKFAFTSGINISDFSYRGDTLGEVTLHAYNSDNIKYNLDLDVTGQANNLKVDGYYLADSMPTLNLQANLVRLDLSTVESFTMGQLQDLNGLLTGNLKVTGTLSDPDINGKLTFRESSFRVSYLQNLLSIDNETITFNKTGISFDGFTLRDKDNNEALVDGMVLTDDYTVYQFDLKVKAKDFLILNTTEDDNDLFYGNLAINTTAHITGTSNQPDIQLNLSPKAGSNLTYVIPEEEIHIQEREGVVEFFDKDQEEDPFLKETKISIKTDSMSHVLKGMNLTAKIDVSRNSTFSVVIDPITGDKLTVQGDANLTLGIKPSGDMTLTGRYEVYDGSYNLNFYGLVKREFNIAQGSYLIWTGDPLNARMDITATYTVSAVYEIPGAINQTSTQKAPFIVYLDIKNELLNPDISFRLGLEESAVASGAEAFVAQVNKNQNELNAQVFYLLLFKSTKDLQSFSTTGASGNIAESTARSSASRILSNQLNKLAGKIEGVELSLDLQSYNTLGNRSGGTTQLELGLSKQLFNNRVVVKVAGNFGLEGEQAEQQQGLSDFAGDIRLEYKLTKDGRFRLVGFRENEYDNLLQGEVVKTGAGIIFVRDYDSFKELFKAKDKEVEQRKGGQKKSNKAKDSTK